MVSRPDLVIVAIPLLALGGFVLGRTVAVAEALAGVGGSLSAVPFAVIGLVAALVVILGELLVFADPG